MLWPVVFMVSQVFTNFKLGLKIILIVLLAFELVLGWGVRDSDSDFVSEWLGYASYV